MDRKQMPKFPKKVKISHKTFTITEDATLAQIADVVGVCNQDNQEIRIDKQLGEDAYRETVLHELLHGCWNLTLLEKTYTSDQQEHIIYALSPFILQMLQDNPTLVHYLTKGTHDRSSAANYPARSGNTGRHTATRGRGKPSKR